VADSWIGGDLSGLHTMVTTLRPAPEDMRGVVSALSSRVDSLVHDAGWSGHAADAFRRAWTADSVAAGTLSEVVGGVGDTLSTLVSSLDILERAQREAAETARSAGVSVEGDGSVRPFVAAVPAGATTSPVVTAANTYTREVNGLREEARQVRLQAQQDLAKLLDQLLAEGPKATPDLYVTAADYLRGLLAAPNEGNRVLLSTYRDRMAALQQARKDAKAAVAAARAAGVDIRPGDPAYAPYRKAIDAIKDLDRDAKAARAGTEPGWSKLLNYKVGDFAAVAALEEAGKLPRFLEFAKDIPVVDIAATGAAAALQAKDDIEKGWSPEHAIAADVGAGVLGLGAGLGAAALIASAPVSVPAAAVAVAAGAVAVGVGDFAYQAFHEHWSEDMHDHGAVAGVFVGIGHSGARVGDDVSNMASDLGHGAEDLGKSLWHGMFG